MNVPIITRKVIKGRFCNTNEMSADVNTDGISQSITATYCNHADSTDHSNLVMVIVDDREQSD